MSTEYFIQEETLTNIADAIRDTVGVTETMTPPLMPEYIKLLSVPDYIKTEAERVIAQVKSHQNENTFSFLAVSDAHYLATNQYIVDAVTHAGQGMYYVREGLDLDFVVNLGDNSWGSSISGSETTITVGTEEIKSVNKNIALAFRNIPNFRTPGNHDSLSYNYAYNGNDYLDEDEIFEFFGEYNTGCTFQSGEENRGYCYRDMDALKLRVIVMNTCDLKDLNPANGESMYTSGTQMKWLAQTIDLSSKSDAADWSFIIFSHHPLDFGISIYCNKILKAYLEGTSVSFTRDNITISYDYSGKNAATFIGNIHGHNHNYLVDKLRWLVSGSTTEAINAKRVCVPNACYLRNNERGQNGTTDVFDIEFGEAITYPKTSGTASNTSFYVITVDPVAKYMYLDHYGAGYSQAFPYISYTNMLFNATTERGGTEIYNGIGYKTNTRMNSSVNIVDCTGMCLTGWIPYNMGDVIRIKNVTVTGTENPYIGRWQSSSSTGAALAAATFMGDPDENGVYTFVIDKYDSGHFRLSFGTITDNTIITINQEIIGGQDNASNYTITNNLSNITSSNTTTTISSGQAYSATLTANKGIIGDVVVTMDDVDVTSSVYSNGSINIARVTGNVVIAASAITGNLVPYMTTAYGGTEIYNGIGYKTGVRMNSSLNIVDASGMCLTGYLKVKQGDVLRIKNISINTLTGDPSTWVPYWVRYSIYNSAVVLEPTGILGTADSSGVYTVTIDQYTLGFRLSVGVVDSSTIITLNEEIQAATYTVKNNLTNVTSNNSSTSASEGSSYTATLTPNSGYTLGTVTVTMGGTNITSSAYSNGVITISKITGNIVITAAGVAPSYTNVIPTAQVFTAGSTAPLEGVGYKNNAYPSSSGGNTTASGFVSTGLIPYVRANSTFPTIYVKSSAQWTAVAQCRFYFYNSSKTVLDPASYGGNAASPANIDKYLTRTSLGTNYWKWEPTSELKSAGFGYNVAYIAFSLKGTGEDLIVTLDEPIE